MTKTKREIVNSDDILFLTRRLVDNCVITRETTLKVIAKYLFSKSKMANGLTQEDYNKIWKGLFFTMYNADKLLYQEDLAQRISCLIHVIQGSSQKLMFFEVALMTFSREWNAMDKFRMDKFLMLLTRTVRQCLFFLKSTNWNQSDVLSTANLLEDLSICPMDDNNTTPLGLKLNVVRILLQEIAKVSNGDVPDDVLFTFINPYLKVLVFTESRIFCRAIEHNILHALIRQSDEGVKYLKIKDAMERLQLPPGATVVSVEEEEGIERLKRGPEDIEDDYKRMRFEKTLKDIKEAQELYHYENEEFDPRAGGVNVSLPQLKIDYNRMATLITSLGSIEETQLVRRKRLYNLAKKFMVLASGDYPFKIKPVNVPDVSKEKFIERRMQKLSKKKEISDDDLFNDPPVDPRSNKPSRQISEIKIKVPRLSRPDRQKRLQSILQRKKDLITKVNEITVRCITEDSSQSNENNLQETIHETEESGEMKASSKKRKVSQDCGVEKKKKKCENETENKMKKIKKVKKVISTKKNKIITKTEKSKKETSVPEVEFESKKLKVLKTSESKLNSKTGIKTIAKSEESNMVLQGKKRQPKKMKKQNKPADITPLVSDFKNAVKRDGWFRKQHFRRDGNTKGEKGTQETEVQEEIVIPYKKETASPKRNMIIKETTPKVNSKGRVLRIDLRKNEEIDDADYVQTVRSSPALPFSAHKKPLSPALKNLAKTDGAKHENLIRFLKRKACNV